MSPLRMAESVSSASSPLAGERSLSARSFRRIALLSGSTTLSHLLLLAASPLLTRLYGPADFGRFGIYQSVLAVCSLLLTLQFEQAIVIPEQAKEAVLLRRLSLLLALGLTALASLLVVWLQSRGLLPSSWLAPLVVAALPLCALAEATARTCRLDAVRESGFRRMGAARITLSAGTLVGQVGLALAGWKTAGLALGDGLGRWLSVLPFLLRRGRVAADQEFATTVMNRPDWRESLRETKNLALRFRRFPLLLTPAVICGLLVNALPALILPALYGAAFAGQFGLANRMILLPMMILSQAVTHVYVSDVSRMIRERDPALPGFVRTAARQLAIVGAALAIPVAALGPFLFPVLFGEQWRLAGMIAPLLAVSGFAQFVGGPVNQVLVSLQQESRKLALHVAGVAAVACVFAGSAWLRLSPMQATGLYVVAILGLQGWAVRQSLTASRDRAGTWAGTVCATETALAPGAAA